MERKRPLEYQLLVFLFALLTQDVPIFKVSSFKRISMVKEDSGKVDASK